MLERRLQILLDEQRYERLRESAAQRQVSVATVVREAIDHSLAPVASRRQAAGQRVLDAAEIDLPSAVDDLLTELDTVRGRRG